MDCHAIVVLSSPPSSMKESAANLSSLEEAVPNPPSMEDALANPSSMEDAGLSSAGIACAGAPAPPAVLEGLGGKSVVPGSFKSVGGGVAGGGGKLPPTGEVGTEDGWLVSACAVCSLSVED